MAEEGPDGDHKPNVKAGLADLLGVSRQPSASVLPGCSRERIEKTGAFGWFRLAMVPDGLLFTSWRLTPLAN